MLKKEFLVISIKNNIVISFKVKFKNNLLRDRPCPCAEFPFRTGSNGVLELRRRLPLETRIHRDRARARPAPEPRSPRAESKPSFLRETSRSLSLYL